MFDFSPEANFTFVNPSFFFFFFDVDVDGKIVVPATASAKIVPAKASPALAAVPTGIGRQASPRKPRNDVSTWSNERVKVWVQNAQLKKYVYILT